MAVSVPKTSGPSCNPRTQFPPEIVTQILVQANRHDAPCVFQLFTPEWDICGHTHREGRLREALRTVRVDTYTVLEDGPGEVSTSFNHGQEDHLYLPMLDYPALADDLPPFYRRELLKAWAGDRLVIIDERRGSVGSLSDPDLPLQIHCRPILRDPLMTSLLPYIDKPFSSGTWAIEGLCDPHEPAPTRLYKFIRHLMFRVRLDYLDLVAGDFEDTTHGRNPVAGENFPWVEAWLTHERMSQLVVEFGNMPRLESLFLDLRGYSRDLFEDEHFLRLATENLLGKGLKLLVIAGLRSGPWYPGPTALTLEVEGSSEGSSRDLNDWGQPRMQSSWHWIRRFRRAVRPGGRLILVDRACDEHGHVNLSRQND